MAKELTRQEAATIAGVTPKTIWTWTKASKFKFRYSKPNRIHIDEESFLSFLESSTDVEKRRQQLLRDIDLYVNGHWFDSEYHKLLAGLFLYRFAMTGYSPELDSPAKVAELLKRDITSRSQKLNPYFVMFDKMVEIVLNSMTKIES